MPKSVSALNSKIGGGIWLGQRRHEWRGAVVNLGIKNYVGINRGPDALYRVGKVCAERRG